MASTQSLPYLRAARRRSRHHGLLVLDGATLQRFLGPILRAGPFVGACSRSSWWCGLGQVCKGGVRRTAEQIGDIRGGSADPTTDTSESVRGVMEEGTSPPLLKGLFVSAGRRSEFE